MAEDGNRTLFLIQEPAKIVFCYAQLLEDFVKQPASDLVIAMNRNGCCPAVRMLPPGVAPLMPYHPKSKRFSNLLQVASFGRHKVPSHQHPLGAYALLLHAPL